MHLCNQSVPPPLLAQHGFPDSSLTPPTTADITQQVLHKLRVCNVHVATASTQSPRREDRNKPIARASRHVPHPVSCTSIHHTSALFRVHSLDYLMKKGKCRCNVKVTHTIAEKNKDKKIYFSKSCLP